MAELILKTIGSGAARSRDGFILALTLAGLALRGVVVAMVVVGAVLFSAVLFVVSRVIGGWGRERGAAAAARRLAEAEERDALLEDAEERFRRRLKDRLVERGRLAETAPAPKVRLASVGGGEVETLAALKETAANRNGV